MAWGSFVSTCPSVSTLHREWCHTRRMRALPPGFRRLPSGRIGWRVQVNGRRVTGSADSLTEAKQARARAQIVEGGDAPQSDVTVAEVIDAYLSGEGAQLAPATRSLDRTAARLMPPAFSARPAGDVRPVHVAALWEQLVADGVKVSMIGRLAIVCSKAWKAAAVIDWVSSNPFTIARPPTRPPADEVNPPSTADVRRLIELCGDHPLALVVRLAAVTGARRGELAALQWDDFRLDAPEVVIRRSLAEVDRDLHVGNTKTGRRGHRVIPLDPATVRALRAHERIVGCPWVFTFDGHTPWRPPYITRALARLDAKHDLGFTFHGLRHYAATQWLGAGEAPATVAGLLGHTTVATVLRTYSHLIPAQGRNLIDSHAARLDA